MPAITWDYLSNEGGALKEFAQGSARRELGAGEEYGLVTRKLCGGLKIFTSKIMYVLRWVDNRMHWDLPDHSFGGMMYGGAIM